MVSANGPLVMKVLLPLRMYSSPSRRAVDFMPPRASDPESGSVMAQAPTFSAVSRERPQRSIWAGVPCFMMVPAARPTLTPEAALFALDLLLEPVPGQLVQAEGGVHLPDDVVGGKVAVLERLDVRDHL